MCLLYRVVGVRYSGVLMLYKWRFNWDLGKCLLHSQCRNSGVSVKRDSTVIGFSLGRCFILWGKPEQAAHC